MRHFLSDAAALLAILLAVGDNILSSYCAGKSDLMTHIVSSCMSYYNFGKRG